jgi:3-oxoacyl-[acyl-carrier-protein] synthase-3
LATRLCESLGPVLVVGAEKMSAILQRDLAKETAILFGDGAGAAVVGPGPGPLEILDARWGSDGAFAEDLKLEFGAALHMNGRAVIMQANRKLTAAVQDLLQRNALDPSAVDLFLFHQANLNLLRQIAKTLGIDIARVPITLDRYGNTSAASVLIAAAAAWKEGRIAPGTRAIMAAFGAGFSWGAVLFEAR